MGYRRRRIFKRRPYRRVRRYKRRYVKRRPSLIHYFKRTKVDEFTITNAGFVAIKSDVVAGDYNDFRLDQLPNYTEFTELYDTYKISAIRQKFIYNRNSAEVALANAELPQLITINDFNDSTALANEVEALQYASFKSVRLDRPVSRYFKPTSEGQVSRRRNQWFRTESPTISHYGLKVAIDTISSAGGTTLGTLKVFTTFYMAMRTPK